MNMTRLASNEIFSPSNKINREVGRAKDLSASRYTNELSSVNTYIDEQDIICTIVLQWLQSTCLYEAECCFRRV